MLYRRKEGVEVCRERKEDGFYSPYVPARFRTAKCGLLLPSGSLTLFVHDEQHVLPESNSSIAEFHGCVFEEHDEYPVALVEWLILDCGSAESWDDIQNAANNVNEQFDEWIGLLGRTALFSPRHIRANERIMNLCRLETRRDTGGRGLGISIGRSLMQLMGQQNGAIFATTKPFPLQFEGASSLGEIDQQALSTARNRLFELYTSGWNAEPIDGGSHLLMPIRGNRIDTVSGNWLLV